MIEYLSEIELKSSEWVEAVVVSSPDEVWHDKITALLAHKDEIWRWQVANLLSEHGETGVETRFYLLHRDEVPFTNIMTVERDGVGLFGHVWTRPQDRQQGAASALMEQAMNHFRERGGKALYLGTGFESGPFRIYRKWGFEPVEAGSGTMSYAPHGIQQFEADYFAPGATEIVPFGWPQWAVASALFTADHPGVVRNTSFKLHGRALTEGELLPLVRQESQRPPEAAPRAQVLQKTSNGALVGLASWDFDPLWPDTCLVDVWCHPHFWEHADPLLASLKRPDTQRSIAFSDATCPQKASVLQATGFQAQPTWPRWLKADKSEQIDVTMWIWQR